MSNDKVIAEVLAKAGTVTAIAAAIGGDVKRQNVEYWLRRVPRRFPAEHCPAIERAYGVPCERLRADLNWSRSKPEAGWPMGRPLLDFTEQVA